MLNNQCITLDRLLGHFLHMYESQFRFILVEKAITPYHTLPQPRMCGCNQEYNIMLNFEENCRKALKNKMEFDEKYSDKQKRTGKYSFIQGQYILYRKYLPIKDHEKMMRAS